MWTDVSRYSTLTLTSTDQVNLNVTKNGADWQLIVPVGASSVSGASPVIGGRLSDSCFAPIFTGGYGYANTNLSVPIAIVLAATVTSLARPGTPASSTLGIATSTQITVTVTFRSAAGAISYKVFSTDPRTVYNTSFVNCVGTLSGSALLSLTSASGVGSAGSVSVTVTLPTYSSAFGLSGNIVIPVVDVNTAIPLIGSLVHTMTTSVPVSAVNPLSQLACTGVFQSGQLSTVTATLTDGSTRSGTPFLSSNNTAVATISGTTITALSPGAAIITAVFATAVGTFSAYVNATGVSVLSVSLTYASATLAGQTGSISAGSVGVIFSDGTSFANAVVSFSPLAALIGFSSSDPAFITISSSGVASLVNNSWRPATLTAFSQCGDGKSGNFSLAGNLAAVYPDSKLGASSGLTFPPASFGQTVDASVRVQVSTSPLTTYQMWLFYNSAVFGTPTISKGSGWPVGSFSFSTGNLVSGNIMKAILSFSSGSSATSTSVLLASVVFPVITSSPVLELIVANVLTFRYSFHCFQTI